MRILVTGTKGIAAAIQDLPYDTVAVSRTTGHDISNWREWVNQFNDVDVVINNAQFGFYQTELLVHFARQWQDDSSKLIINIGSIVSDYRKSSDDDTKFCEYRLHKQALQNAFNKLSRECKCRIALINPGLVDTTLVSHITEHKMKPSVVANYVDLVIKSPELRRIDLWE